MSIFAKFFKKKSPSVTDEEPVPLRIEGIPEAPFTQEPDDAELAAQAVLEMMSGKKAQSLQKTPNNQDVPNNQTSAYYHALADRIREAHRSSVLRTVRFVAFCELELQKPDLPLYGKDSIAQMERELYKRIDVIEREGGELKRRWQHCLAEVTVRLIKGLSPIPPVGSVE